MPPMLRESPTQALYRAALGPVQSEHHLRAFERFDALGAATPSWNWAAALLTLNWLVYRRLWRMAGLYLALVLLAAGLLYGLAWGRLPDGVTLGLVAAAAVLATVVPGLYGNAWLHAQLRLALVAAARDAPSLADTVDTLRRRAPSLARLGALVLVNLLLGALLASGWLAGRAAGAMASATSSATVGKPAEATSAESGGADSATIAARVASTQAVEEAATATSTSIATDPAAPAQVLTDPPVQPPASDKTLAPPPVLPVSPPEAAAVPAPLPLPPVAQAPAAPAPSPRPVAPPAPVPAPAPAPRAASESAATPPASTAPGGHVINVGLFADPANAERALAQIRRLGLPASADTLVLERGPRTRVRAGPFARRAEADRAAARIKALGLEARVVSPARPARPPG